MLRVYAHGRSALNGGRRLRSRVSRLPAMTLAASSNGKGNVRGPIVQCGLIIPMAEPVKIASRS